MDAIWQEIREHLQQEKQAVTAEIRRYPAPIPACDVQFNYLMQKRAAITRELGRLESTVKQARIGADMHHSVDVFLDSSLCLSNEAKAAITRLLRDIISA